MRTDIGNARGERELSKQIGGIFNGKLNEVLHVRASAFEKWWLKNNFGTVTDGIRELVREAILQRNKEGRK